MNWVLLSLGSALLLGTYDVAKKYALRRNPVMYVLLVATALSTLFLSPWLGKGPLDDHLFFLGKSVLVSASWIFGLYAIKLVPLTTVSTIKASRPVFIVLFSILLFGERLSLVQWIGVLTVITALYFLSRTSRKEGVPFGKSRGISYMFISVLAGVASAILDKYILFRMEPLYLQSWSNFYITLDLAIVVIVRAIRDGKQRERLTWDWTLVLIACLISFSDALYFFALKQDGSMLSIVSMVRRTSVVVTFALGAVLFKENRIRAKAWSLAMILIGVSLLMLSTI